MIFPSSGTGVGIAIIKKWLTSLIFVGIFTKVGDKFLYHDNTMMTYPEAKQRCQTLDSSLVELWTDQEYQKVKYTQLLKLVALLNLNIIDL